jgi:hypothetical protein
LGVVGPLVPEVKAWLDVAVAEAEGAPRSDEGGDSVMVEPALGGVVPPVPPQAARITSRATVSSDARTDTWLTSKIGSSRDERVRRANGAINLERGPGVTPPLQLGWRRG